MSLSAPFIAWLAKPGNRVLLADIGCRSGGVEITRRISNTGFATGATDAPANTYYEARLNGGITFSRRLALPNQAGSLSSGSIDLDDTDGGITAWLDDIWARRSITLRLGEGGDPVTGAGRWPLAQFEVIWAGTVDDLVRKDRSTLSLNLLDSLAVLNDTLSTAVVGGIADNKDALRPQSLGECFNVTPLLLDAATQTYGVHLDAAIESVVEVRDNGIPVLATQYVANGMFTLTKQRFGTITCDVQGAKIAGDWRKDAGGLIEWVATVLGDGQMLDPAQIDAAQLAAFRAACTQSLGVYITGRTNRRQVMDQIAASVGATVTTSAAGLMRIVRLAFGAPTRTIGPANMKEGSFKPLAYFTPVGAQHLSGCRNWTPQTTDLAGAVVAMPENTSILGDEWTYALATDATVLSYYRQNGTPDPVETYMVVESELATEAGRLKDLWKVPRVLWGFDGYPELLDAELGDSITLEHPRLSGGSAPGVICLADHGWLPPGVSMGVLV
jgi:hypothetical protein